MARSRRSDWDRDMFRGGLVFKARRLFESLNSRPRVLKKKKKRRQASWNEGSVCSDTALSR
jgi:hypothetical protein